ncbi:hypothetical protein ACJX0J_020447, partial [Zea mays]
GYTEKVQTSGTGWGWELKILKLINEAGQWQHGWKTFHLKFTSQICLEILRANEIDIATGL